jgi:hypothetical protein
MGFPNFFKLSPKTLYFGPKYPKKLRLFVIYNFLTPISMVDSKNSLVLQYDLNIYATLAKICQAANFLAHVIKSR